MKYDEKRSFEFSLLKELEKYDVQTHKAIEYTVVNEANLSVMVLSYIKGKPASEIITDLSDTEQLTLGFAAGKELRKIHQLNVHKSINWEEVQTKKFRYYLNEYKRIAFMLQKNIK